MGDLFEPIFSFMAERPGITLGVLVFLAATMLAFGVMAAIHARGAVRRRAALMSADDVKSGSDDPRSLRHASSRMAQRLIDYTTRHYSTEQDSNKQQLRRRLMQAGFFDPRAPVFFIIGRVVFAVLFGAVAIVASPLLLSQDSNLTWVSIWFGAILGYFAPNIFVNRRIVARCTEHRSGFPDFMDLLVVCANAGLSMEAALTRVGAELGDTYPSLSANIYMTTLEIRAGRKLSEALEHFGDRIGIEEARSFATLLQQSEELGSSLSDALRVYSDDMRHKRLSDAEEKAHSLPAKLSVPLMVFVFPVVIVVILLPVFVRVKLSIY
jgi:tight adherence protein C